MTKRYKELLKEYKKELTKAKDRYRKSAKLKSMWILSIPAQIPQTVQGLKKHIKELKAISIKNIKGISEHNPFGDVSKLSSFLKNASVKTKEREQKEGYFSPKDVTELNKAISKANKNRKKYFLEPLSLKYASYQSDKAIKSHINTIRHYNTQEYLNYKSKLFVDGFFKSLESVINQMSETDELYKYTMKVLDKANKMGFFKLLGLLNSLNDLVIIDEIYGSDQEMSKAAWDTLFRLFDIKYEFREE